MSVLHARLRSWLPVAENPTCVHGPLLWLDTSVTARKNLERPRRAVEHQHLWTGLCRHRLGGVPCEARPSGHGRRSGADQGRPTQQGPPLRNREGRWRDDRRGCRADTTSRHDGCARRRPELRGVPDMRGYAEPAQRKSRSPVCAPRLRRDRIGSQGEDELPCRREPSTVLPGRPTKWSSRRSKRAPRESPGSTSGCASTRSSCARAPRSMISSTRRRP